MEVQETLSKARDAITVKRVYGDPYERDGVTVIPAATVAGGGGGGSGVDPETGQTGGGSGFGIGGRPVGAYVIENGKVRWEAAVDVSRLVREILVVVAGLALLIGRRRAS